MCFNGTGIWGSETLHLIINRPISSPDGGGGLFTRGRFIFNLETESPSF